MLSMLRRIKHNIFGTKPVEYCNDKKIDKVILDENYIIVDTRPSGEFGTSSIINSVNLPQTTFLTASRKKLHPSMKVILVDRNGHVAVNAYYTLKERHFPYVRVLKGGINNLEKTQPHLISKSK